MMITALERSEINYCGGESQSHPQFLKWFKTLSWLFGLHDNSPMNPHGKQVNQGLKQRRGLHRYDVLRVSWRSLGKGQITNKKCTN